MKLFLIRHGESAANVAQLINDDPSRPVGLTARGRVQAAATAKQLRMVPFTYAYASEFLRTQQTAEILLRYHACPLQVDARLNERHTGMDGKPVELFNAAVRPDPLYVRPPGGESFVEEMERLRAFLDEIASRHSGGIVMAVSHENPILAAQALTTGDLEQSARDSLANCAWLELEWPRA